MCTVYVVQCLVYAALRLLSLCNLQQRGSVLDLAAEAVDSLGTLDGVIAAAVFDQASTGRS